MAATLAEALLELQADLPVLVKDRKGQVGNQKTKYADLVQANEQVLSRLNKLGIIYTCAPTLDDEGKFVLAYELEHVESKTSKIGRYPLKLSENPMQMGSAITYARRYVLLALTGVVAEDEDDDGQAATGRRTAQRATQASREPAADRPTAQRAQRPAGPPLLSEQDRITEPQMRKLQALFSEQGYTAPDDKQAFLVKVVGHPLGSTKELTKREAASAIDRLEKRENPEEAE